MTQKETYLGDGLYASFDGWQIRLRAPRSYGEHEVFLDPQVLAAFKRFLETSLATRLTEPKYDQSL